MSASHTIRHYVKYLRCTSYDLSLLWPARTSRRQGGVLLKGHPRPLPVAKPRTLRVPAHKVQPVCAVVGDGRLSLAWSVVCCSAACRLQHFVPDKEDGLTVAGSLQIIFLVFHSRAGRCRYVSQQPKSCHVPAPFSHSTNNSFSSAHFLRSRSKVSRFAACVYTAAPVECLALPVIPLPQHTPLPLVAACPWSLSDFLSSFSKRRQEDR